MRQREVLLLVVLVAGCFSGGCASRRRVLNPEADSTAVSRISAEPLHIGDRLELELRDGGEARGFLRALPFDSLTLSTTKTPKGRPDRRHPRARAVALAQIRAGIRNQGEAREPLLLLEGPCGSGLALFALPIERGDLLTWQTRDGVCGVGYFVALEADTLVLADRQRWRQDYSHWHQYSSRPWPPTLAATEEAGALCRLPWVDLAELQCRNDHAQERIGSQLLVASGFTIIAAVLVAVAMEAIAGIADAHTGPWLH
jgi:hypothetical protein